MTPWHHTPIVHIHTPVVAGGDTMSSITEKARAQIEERSGDYAARWGSSMTEELALHRAYTKGAETGYAVRAAEEPSDEQVAQIIDQHRVVKRWVGDGVSIECACRFTTEHTRYSGSVPLDDEHNSHRDADRAHAVHVAAQLRAARDTGEQA